MADLNQLEQFKEQISLMPEEERSAFLQSLVKDYMGGSESITREETLADELRGAELPGMQRAGPYSVATGLGGVAGSLAQKGIGQYRSDQAGEQREEQSDEKQKALFTLMQQMMAGGGAPGGAPGGGGSPAAAMLRRANLPSTPGR